MTPYDGIVLAGGAGRRMGGRDKPSLLVGSRPMIAAPLDALRFAREVLVVGPDGDLVERPPGAGPVAAIAAALSRVTAPVVVVLAADLPFVSHSAVERLVSAAPAVATDDAGRPQYLLAAYSADELRDAIPAVASGVAMRRVVAALATAPAMVDLADPGAPAPWWDCDTPEQLEAARRWV